LLEIIAAFVMLCTAAWPGFAQSADGTPYVWRNVTIGGGGFAPNIIFSRAERGLAYLRTDMGGAYRWDSRLRHWLPLQDSNPVSSYMGIESLAADPKDPDVVYLAAGMGSWGQAAIWRSADRGASWRITPVPFKMGGNEDGRGMGERLAIDPHRTSTLFFGTRHDGLWRSDDSGASWRKVASFPYAGAGPPKPRSTHGGISFVIFDPRGAGVVYAGIADPVRQHLYSSRDGGQSWSPVKGERSDLLPVKADFDNSASLYIAYSNGIGPNGITRGAVWRLDTRSGGWTDITPAPNSEGGYMGLSVDRARPGRLVVSSVDRWKPGDTVWLSSDFGRTWVDLKPRSRRDTFATPFLNWGEKDAEFGHWIAGLAIDPFNGGTIAYTTGATLYRTDDALKDRTLTWRPWVKGIEQTAVITLISPTGGAHLITGFGDIAGFVHDRFDVSPTRMHLNPRLNNTNNLDYAGLAPNVVVRSGSRHKPEPDGASLAWSDDSGLNWTPIKVPPIDGERHDTNGNVPINVSADGRLFVVATPDVLATKDRGRTWFAPAGLPRGARVIADKADPQLFYALDFANSRFFVSRDGARMFTLLAPSGLPKDFSKDRPRNREAQFPLQATPGRPGELWLLLGGELFHSTESGGSFQRASNNIAIELFGLGRAAPGRTVPAVYAVGTRDGIRGVWRSDDGGSSWIRINDDAHQWGLRFRAISGDPRVYGRVYVATDGRGVVYGDPKE
jgi:hypothetical protein